MATDCEGCEGAGKFPSALDLEGSRARERAQRAGNDIPTFAARRGEDPNLDARIGEGEDQATGREGFVVRVRMNEDDGARSVQQLNWPGRARWGR